MKLPPRIKNLISTCHHWVRQLLYRRRVTQLIEQAQSTSATRPHRALVEQLLQELQPERFGAYQVLAGQTHAIVALAPNIESYTQQLAELMRLVRAEQPLQASAVAFETETHLSVDHFLISKDGYYVNQEKSVAAFRRAALRLCEVLKPADSEEVGMFEHNQRMLTRLFVNLRHVTVALLQVSLTK